MIAHALIVGVARYRSVTSLPEAVRNDVEDIANILCDPGVGGLDPNAVTLLIDEEATASGIRNAFHDIAATMRNDGNFLFYFSGHGERGIIDGGEQSWLLPHDADLDDLGASALSSREIVSLLDDVGARREVLMIDACHAGGIGSAKGSTRTPKGFGMSGADFLSHGAGRVLLTSSRADELSLILAGARNSLFTSTLIEAFGGATVNRGDGLVGVLDLFAYVSTEVPKRADQHPIFHAGDVDANFAIARRRAEIQPKSLDTNALTVIFAKLYPQGPIQDDLWARAGGDVSRLVLGGTGSAQWHSALTKVQRGGGGLTLSQLIEAAASDYPESVELAALR